MTMTPPFDDAEIKQVVLKGMQGTPISELCEEYGITESIYRQWRDRVFANTVVNGPKVTNNFTYQY